jgi:plastocyanin
VRRALPATLAIAAAAAVAIAVPGSSATTKSVKIGDNYYVRDGKPFPTVTVKRNTRVRWNFRGDKPHDVTVSKGPVKFASKAMSEGSYSRKMTRRGTYKIYCTIHGAGDQSMTLRVTR